MKKISLILFTVLLMVSLMGCQEKTTMYVLNWGDYINEEVVEAFMEDNNINVIVEEVDSNEAMYEKVRSGNTKYDVVVPSDYMIQRMAEEGLLNKLDRSRIVDYQEGMFEPAVYELMEESGIDEYAIPYFYGSIGIMYRNEYEDVVMEHGFGVLFDDSLLPSNARIGMYNSSRDSVAAALLHLGYDVNTTDSAKLSEAEALLSNMDYAVWGDDNLKNEIVAGNLDVALVYSGDYFDILYIVMDEGRDVDFGYMTPMHTNIWVDAMVIPTLSENTYQAHLFINYFLNVDNALENVEYVGYTPVITDVYELMKEDEEWNDITENAYFRDFYYQEGFIGQMYKHVSLEHYQVLEEIMMRAKMD
jgi:spermidine/putrescine-binding protein